MEENSTKQVNKYLVALAVILPTFFVALGTSAANVAMKHIAGFLGATQYETNTVVTMYLIANAMVLPILGWLTKTIGQKNTLYLSMIMFIGGAILCVSTHSLNVLLVARTIQGFGGGIMIPMCQAVLLYTFPIEERGKAMSLFGFSVILPPLLGPTFGGFITDNSSWQWIFLINIPVGILSVILMYLFITDPPEIREKHQKQFDIPGLISVIAGLGCMQYVLDKGQQYNWFDTGWICVLSAISVTMLTFYLVWETIYKNPISDVRVFKDVNFAVGTALGCFIQVVLYSTLMLLPAFLQTILGYSPTMSGLSILPRSLSVTIMLIVVGKIADKIDNRVLIAIGLIIIGFGTFMFTNLNLTSSIAWVVIPNLVLGAGIAFTFTASSSISFATLPKNKLHDAAGLGSLARAVAAAFSTSLTATSVERFSQVHQGYLVSNLSQYSLIFQNKLAQLQSYFSVNLPAFLAAKKANAVIYHDLLIQSRLMAYFDTFAFLAVVSFCAIPLCLLFQIKSYSGKSYLKKQYIWFMYSIRHYKLKDIRKRIRG